MNIINQFLLRIFLSPALLYKKANVDLDQLRLILTTKLIIDDRRPNTFHRSRQNTGTKTISLATLGTMLFSAVLGCMFLFAFGSGSLDAQLLFYFSIYMFMLISTLIADFTSVLFDVKDNAIILPKPVSDKTFVASRLLHIIMHCTKIVLPMTLPGIIFISIRNDFATGLSLFCVLLMATLFTIFLINAIYLVVLKFTTPQKFNAIISYVQIILSIAVYAGFQFLPRFLIIPAGDMMHNNSWLWCLPSYWFALATLFFSSFKMDPALVIAALITFVASPLSIWIVIKYFAPAFTQKLGQITAGSEEQPATSVAKTTIKSGLLPETLAQWATGGLTEKLGFINCWILSNRLKDFKLKVYPSIGYIVVYMVIMFFKDGQKSLQNVIALNQQGVIIILSVLYAVSLILITAINQLPFTEQYKASWIYFSLPLKKPGHILSGAYKAIIIKFYTPFAFVLSAAAIYLTGPSIIPSLLLSFSNIFLTGLVNMLFVMKIFPFTMQQNAAQKSGSFVRILFSLVLPGILGIIHFFVFKSIVGIIVVLICSMVLNYFLLQKLRNRNWSAINSSYLK
ncbi:MAG: hypothetical protein ABIR81_09480 [Ginsengibacter sp.]